MSEPIAKVRVTNGGYAMTLATYVAYGLSEGDHWLYARTDPAGSEPVADTTAEALGHYAREARNIANGLEALIDRLPEAPPREVAVGQTPVDDHQDGLASLLLNLVTVGDHERGCEGRTYSCSCGYDANVERLIRHAAARIQSDAVELARVEREVVAGIVTWLREGFPGAVPMRYLNIVADDLERGDHCREGEG